MTMRALIAEDEPLARRKLRRLLEEIDDVELVAESADGHETVACIDELEPDLVFLDIQLPGATGLEVLERTEHEPHVIFTTAFDRYAVAAFEMHAIDYLMKPFGRERLGVALARARERLGRDEPPTRAERLGEALASDRPLHRLFVRTRSRIVPIAVDDIECLEADGDYVRVHAGGQDHLVHVRLKDLHARLDPARFLRVHRSAVINLDHLSEMEPEDNSRFQLTLDSGLRVRASRSGARELRQLVL